jgi:hypothetical protein
MTTRNDPRRRVPFLAMLAAVAGALVVALAAGRGEERSVAAEPAVAAEHHHARPGASPMVHTPSAHAFQDRMRKLWEDHITWTRLAIVSFVDDLSDLDATVARLLRNQSDIGAAIKPYYGKKAGKQLTALLEEHINGAVELIAAAKAGNAQQVEQASDAWYRNGKEIADFLSAANPDNWPRKAMRSMMRKHLDQTLAEATQRLEGDHEAEVRTYDRIHRHILEMADALSDGIVAQFPRRFR